MSSNAIPTKQDVLALHPAHCPGTIDEIVDGETGERVYECNYCSIKVTVGGGA